MQRRVFPLLITGLQPADLDTARCRHVGHGEDGLSYYIKRCCDGPRTPCAELICHELAAAINLAVPPSHVAVLSNGEEVFASREEGGLMEQDVWLRSIVFGKHPPPSLAGHLSAWWAFDLFVHNPDRHVDNFMMRQTNHGTSLIAIDFSEAWHVSAWPLPNELGPCHTTDTRSLLRGRFPLDRGRFEQVLDRVGKLPDDWLSEVLSHVPVRWLDATLKAHMEGWWKQDRHSRIDRIRLDHADER